MPFDGGLYVNGNGELVLTFEKALYDYDTMWLLLEENYPYLDRIEAEMGIDWRAVRDKYRVIMERTAGAGGGWLTQEKFIGIIDKCLYDFHYVGHLYVIDTGFWRKMSDDWVTFEEGSLIHTLGTLVRNPKSVQFYEAWEELDGRGASERSTDGGFAKGETVPPGMTLDMVEGIPYVKLSTFSDWTDDTYAALSQFFSTIKDQEHLIIDIQGNGGGSTNAWGKGIVSALAGKTVESNYLNCAKAGTLNLALDPRFTERRGDYMESPGVYEDDSWQEDFPYVQPEYVEGMDLFFKNTIRVEPSDTSINFQGKIWVLIDKECYSAAEGFTAFCKSTGFATLVGTETGGSGLTS